MSGATLKRKTDLRGGTVTSSPSVEPIVNDWEIVASNYTAVNITYGSILVLGEEDCIRHNCIADFHS